MKTAKEWFDLAERRTTAQGEIEMSIKEWYEYYSFCETNNMHACERINLPQASMLMGCRVRVPALEDLDKLRS